MNVKATNKVETNRYELELEVSPEEFNDAINAVFKRESKKINIPGFRKGHAPGLLSRNITARKSSMRLPSTTCTAPW